MTAYVHQDWKTLVIHGKQAPCQQVRSRNDVDRFKRSGGETETIKKYQAGKNVQRKKVINTKKLEDEETPLKFVSKEMGDKISRARQELNLTRKDLGVMINEKENVITDWETGKALYNPQLLVKIQRALKIDFRETKKK